MRCDCDPLTYSLDDEARANFDAWKGRLRPGNLLILDEAHHAAPLSGSKYAIDSLPSEGSLGAGSANEPHYVRVFMANLRKKLEKNPSRPQHLLTEQ